MTARFLSLGVNGLGVALMVVVFAHTGGLTGVEVGVAGGTGVVGSARARGGVRRPGGPPAHREGTRRPPYARPSVARRGARAVRRRVWRAVAVDAGRRARAAHRAAPGGGGPVTEILERRRREKVAARLPERVEALGQAVELVDGRLPGDGGRRRRVASSSRAGGRLKLSPEHTIVALAGATGSGKSSLFNSIVGLDLATVGVRRPTTSAALACVWGQHGRERRCSTGSGIERRHQVMRSSVLEDTDVERPARTGAARPARPRLDGGDATGSRCGGWSSSSTSVVWVLDPQKYADAALHEDFLRPLASHAGVMVFVLNHADSAQPRPISAACVADLRALLDARRVRGLAARGHVGARPGTGLGRLRALLAERVLTRRSFATRVSADLGVAAEALARAHGRRRRRRARRRVEVTALREGLAHAAGVDGIAAAARRSYAVRAAASTGWPPVRWIARLRPDPLKRLGLDRAARIDRPTWSGRRVPAPTPVQRSQVDTTLRRFADGACRRPRRRVGGGDPAGRAVAVGRPSRRRGQRDRARPTSRSGCPRTWWRVLSAMQWVLFAALRRRRALARAARGRDVRRAARRAEP